MSEKAGELARETATYKCENCNQHIRLESGALIPKCPNCGQEEFDISNPRFENADGSLGPHEPDAE